MDIVLSFVLTWTIILLPPLLLRWVRRTAYSKAVAVAVAGALFFTNHIVFAFIGGHASARPFLILGAIAAFALLRWETNASAKDLAQAKRLANGYEVTSEPSVEASPVMTQGNPEPTPAQAGPPLDLKHGSPLQSPPSSTDPRSVIPLRRGLLRLWLSLTFAWLAGVTLWTFAEWTGSITAQHFVQVRVGPDPYDPSRLEALKLRWKRQLQGPPEQLSIYPSEEFFHNRREQELQRLESLISPMLRGGLPAREVVQTLSKIGVSERDIALDPARAEKLADLTQLITVIAESPILARQIFGNPDVTKTILFEVLVVASLLPPALCLLAGLAALWVAAGFRTSRPPSG